MNGFIAGSSCVETSLTTDPGVYETFLPGPFPKGTEVVCLATANDGSVPSTTVPSDTVVIGNTPPGPPTIALEPDPPSPCESTPDSL